jgi:hypothetical protein
VDGLLQRMTARQFRRWQLFWKRAPFGPVHRDLQAGQVCAAVINSQRVEGQAAQAEDFFPSLRPRPRKTADPLGDQCRVKLKAWGR